MEGLASKNRVTPSDIRLLTSDISPSHNVLTYKVQTMNKITVLDGYTLNPGDLSWDELGALGKLTVYDRTPKEAIIDRAVGAEILIVNKASITSEIIAQLPDLQYIGVTATGFNNIDIEAASKRNIAVCNVSGYGTAAVAQHVFALLLAMTNQVSEHHQSVLQGQWAACPDFCYTLVPLTELQGLTMGIYGFGRIGRQVAVLAQAFGMQVLATHKHPERDAMAGVGFVDIDDLFQKSDVVSLHAPLTSENKEIVNAALLRQMKHTAFLINTSRGALINEKDLYSALEKGWLAGAALDVLSVEPPLEDHILIGAPHCIITPHNAWASRAARSRLLKTTVENLRSYLNGAPKNKVN